MSLQQRKERVAILSVVSNSFLVLFKVIVGVLIGSVSIISEAIHSGMDLVGRNYRHVFRENIQRSR